jgi:hypothetical protein
MPSCAFAPWREKLFLGLGGRGLRQRRQGAKVFRFVGDDLIKHGIKRIVNGMPDDPPVL